MSINKLLPGVKKNILLKNYTTFRIGGPAKYFFTAKTKEDLIKAIKLAKKLKLPFFILGRGSNLLVSDKGFNGLVIKFGQPLSVYVSKGLEWAAGIPGTLQAAVYGNAGAFGKSMKDVVESVEVFNIKTEKIKIFKNKDCRFAYRNSIFKHANSPTLPSTQSVEYSGRGMFTPHQNFGGGQVGPCEFPNLIILSVKIKTKKSNFKKIKQCLNYRKKTQPLNFSSAGSIFKNFTPHQNEVSGAGPTLKMALEEFKGTNLISAGYLIEKCGLKGKKIGEAKISEKHSNFIVNLGNGTAKDVIKLINLAKRRVKERFGIKLEEEIQYLGFKNQKLKTSFHFVIF